VSFASAALAALCNSQERLSRRWGPDTAEAVGRRLFDLAAATAATLDRIPEARVVVDSAGESTITFANKIVVRGVINPSKHEGRETRTDADHILITSLDIHGSDRR
jgi:hypothetical protein